MNQSPNVRGDAESGHSPVVAQLEELIRDLPDDDGSQEALMREHLMAARSCLLGAMPAEYELDLKLAHGVRKSAMKTSETA